MSIYKPGRPNKYNPSTGSGFKPPSSPGEYRLRDNTGILCYILVKPATCIVGLTNTSVAANSVMAEPSKTKLPTEGQLLQHDENMSV